MCGIHFALSDVFVNQPTMNATIISTALLTVAVYVFIGVATAACFVCRGIGHVDPAARNTSIVFRMLLVPGCVALWPWILLWWKRALVKEDRR